MQYNRGILDKLLYLSRHFPALLLTGARQTGKTTLLRAAFPQHRYLSLDLPSDAELAENDPIAFLNRYPPPLLLDEIQYAPKIFRHLKKVIDEKRHEPGQFILTGSQKFPLMKGVSDSLAGRCVWLELETLSTQEVTPDFSKFQSQVDILVRGGFPDLWRDKNIPKREFYRSYLATYIERDLRQILNISSLRDFERFIRSAATRNGQILNKTDLARDVGVTPKTISDWISLLETSNQVVLLEPYFSNLNKRIVKSPKLYFCDTGLLCFLLGITEDTLDSSPFLGSIWEAFVFSELRKYLAWGSSEKSLFFYRDQEAREIDFMIYGNGKADLIEVKWTETPTQRDTQSMNELRSILNKKPRHGFSINKQWVACRTPSPFPIGEFSQAISGFELYQNKTGGHIAATPSEQTKV